MGGIATVAGRGRKPKPALKANIAEASKIGFPQNIPMIAGAVSQGVAIVNDIRSIAMPVGQAHDGIMSVPKSGTWNLEKGERVLPKHTTHIKTHKPTAYTAPLLGRDYHHGVQDCYTLVQDYYRRELGIDLPDFPRVDEWWENTDHEPLYEQNFEKAGFVAVNGTPQKHDVILCRVGRTHHINHALVFVGDGKLQSENTPDCVGDCLVLHHPHGRLSVREIYGESWQKRTALVVRHRQLHEG